MLLFACASGSSSNSSALAAQISEAQLREHVEYLSGDRLAGRAPGSPGDEIARDYIAANFSKLGAEALFGETYEQAFWAKRRGETFATANVGAVVRGTTVPEEYIVVVAHHDALGICEADEDARDRICNGAVDNASGVGLLLELARVLNEDPAPRSIIFLASGAEEIGLQGARHFVQNPPVSLSSIVSAFALDTVAARGATSAVGVVGARLTNLDPLIERAAAATGRDVATISVAEDYYDRTDHFAFAEAGVPALVVTGLFAPGRGAFSNSDYARHRYHEAGDEAGPDLDYSGAVADGAVLLNLIYALGEDAERPAWLADAPYRRQ